MVVSDATHIDPKYFFDPKRERPPRSIIAQYWLMATGPLLTTAGVASANLASRRPISAGVQRYFAYAAGGLVIGYYVDKWARERAAKRDHFYYQYMCDHPEDFPIVERKKFATLFEKWNPVR